MKLSPTLIPAAALTLTLAAAVGAAWADPVPPIGPGAGRAVDPVAWTCGDHEARLAARLAYAEVKLNLTAPQKAEFKRLSEALSAAHTPIVKACAALPKAEAAAAGKLPPLPTRLERQEAFVQAHADSLHQAVPALIRFYKVLTPEQQPVADQVLDIGHGHGPGGFGPHHGPRGGAFPPAGPGTPLAGAPTPADGPR